MLCFPSVLYLLQIIFATPLSVILPEHNSLHLVPLTVPDSLYCLLFLHFALLWTTQYDFFGIFIMSLCLRNISELSPWPRLRKFSFIVSVVGYPLSGQGLQQQL